MCWTGSDTWNFFTLPGDLNFVFRDISLYLEISIGAHHIHSTGLAQNNFFFFKSKKNMNKKNCQIQQEIYNIPS